MSWPRPFPPGPDERYYERILVFRNQNPVAEVHRYPRHGRYVGICGDVKVTPRWDGDYLRVRTIEDTVANIKRTGPNAYCCDAPHSVRSEIVEN